MKFAVVFALAIAALPYISAQGGVDDGAEPTDGTGDEASFSMPIVGEEESSLAVSESVPSFSLPVASGSAVVSSIVASVTAAPTSRVVAGTGATNSAPSSTGSNAAVPTGMKAGLTVGLGAGILAAVFA
ncbi:hypothetical protein C8J57DRAFT_1269964 [Mycena rebaudengoi]|nr:hypothetical protein C8J57DRAFT_1269964 [Mycena rebaudengoi]